MTTAEILYRTADVVAAGWCQGGGARNHSGRVVPWSSPDAAFFCLRGALRSVTDGGYVLHLEALLRAQCGDNWNSLAAWNDAPSRKQEEVVVLLLDTAEAVQQTDTTREKVPA